MISTGVAGGLDGPLAQERLRLDRDDSGHGGRVVREVEPITSADLDHSPGQAAEQASPMVALAALLELPARTVEEAREQRQRVVERHCSRVQLPTRQAASDPGEEGEIGKGSEDD